MKLFTVSMPQFEASYHTGKVWKLHFGDEELLSQLQETTDVFNAARRPHGGSPDPYNLEVLTKQVPLFFEECTVSDVYEYNHVFDPDVEY